jgi:hypothetical protein
LFKNYSVKFSLYPRNIKRYQKQSHQTNWKMVLYEGVEVDESNNPSAPPSLPAPYPGFQDAPPSYDEAVLGKSKQSDGQGPPPYPNQPGLPIKGEFHVPVTQFGTG